jgi:hypothetical protein
MRRPAAASSPARLAVMVDFPQPPLRPVIAMMAMVMVLSFCCRFAPRISELRISEIPVF